MCGAEPRRAAVLSAGQRRALRVRATPGVASATSSTRKWARLSLLGSAASLAPYRSHRVPLPPPLPLRLRSRRAPSVTSRDGPGSGRPQGPLLRRWEVQRRELGEIRDSLAHEPIRGIAAEQR
ncbi:hypothetical protein DSC45_04775 [Streptomyces sp. YIM 130001]|nr:hypothetical protein DSC45_04775 [Streptomyces sp. YIM 130001]